MSGAITKRAVDAAQPREDEWCLWDEQLVGFGLRVRPSGVKTYVVRYRAGEGRTAPVRRFTLGRHGAPWTPEQARREAARILGEVAAGKDPAKQKQADRRTRKTAPTVAGVAELWLVEHVAAKRKPRTLRSYRQVLDHAILPALGQTAIAELDRRAVAKMHYENRARPGVANLALKALSALVEWASLHGFRSEGAANPCKGIEKYRLKVHERFLSARELARLARALDRGERSGLVSPVAVAAIRLLVITGMRVSEALNLQWSYVDFAAACLRLPDSKTGPKVVHLCAPALRVLAGLPRQADSVFVFPGSRAGQPLPRLWDPWARIRKAALLSDCRLHDLRHSFASIAAAGGQSLLLVGKMLGHRSVSTTSKYAHLSADPVKAAAEAVGAQIAAAMAGGSTPSVSVTN